jgi:transcription antitermination factor NusB
MDNRSWARELVIQALHQLDTQGSDALAGMDMFFNENCDSQEVRNLADGWARGAWANVELCDSLIQSAAIKWQMSRLCQVDRSILRLGAYQLKFCQDIPVKVVINEAIELAKKYSSQQSPGFVNGVLDAILKKLGQEDPTQ